MMFRRLCVLHFYIKTPGTMKNNIWNFIYRFTLTKNEGRVFILYNQKCLPLQR